MACEQDRPDVAQRRAEWRVAQAGLDPQRLVFLDETWANTNMTRARGRSLRGTRLISKVPHGHWKTTTFLAALRTTGLQIHDALRDRCRKTAGKRRLSRAAIVDSQSVRTAEGGEFRGYDAGKKITGRKRHLAVDTLGLLWMVVVHPADWQDYTGAAFVIARLERICTRLKVIFADSAYGRAGLPAWVQETFGWVLHTVLRPVAAHGFVVLPKRWIVERTFAWISRYRRHSKDYERNPETSEAFIYIAMINLMSRRLARQNPL